MDKVKVFKTTPVACEKFEIGDSEYVCGIFEPEERKNKRIKRTTIVVRNFLGAPHHPEPVTDPRLFPDKVKTFAKNNQASYPASAQEHMAYLSLILQLPPHAQI